MRPHLAAALVLAACAPDGPRLVVVHAPGLGWETLEARLGELPATRALVERGVVVRLEQPGQSPVVAEASLWTGVSPPRHAVTGLRAWDPVSRSVVAASAASRRTAALWELWAGGRRLVVGAAGTWPAHEIDGWQLSDRWLAEPGAALPAATWPPEVSGELASLLPAAGSLPPARRHDQAARAAARLGVGRLKPELVVLSLLGVERAAHEGAGGSAALAEALAWMDGCLADAVEAAGPRAVVALVSAYGAGPEGPHSRGGVLVLAGGEVQKAASPVVTARVVDVLPTLLAAAAAPVPPRLDGRVPGGLVRAGVRVEGRAPPPAAPAAVLAPEADRSWVSEQARLRHGPEAERRQQLLAALWDQPTRWDALAELAGLEEASRPELALALYEAARANAEAGPAMAAPADAARVIDAKRVALLVTLRRPAEARRLLTDLLAAGESRELRLLLGMALEADRRPGEALELYGRLVLETPRDAEVLTRAGRCALGLERSAEAKDFFERAALADAGHAESRYQLALLSEQAGDAAKARYLLEAAAAADQRFVEARWRLAVSAANRGETGAAEEWLRQVLGLAPSMAPAWSLRARVAAAEGRVADARRYLEEARRLDPVTAEAVLSRDERLRSAVQGG